MELIIIWLVIAFVSMAVHERRGNGTMGFVLALLLGIIGFFIAFAFEDKSKKQ